MPFILFTFHHFELFDFSHFGGNFEQFTDLPSQFWAVIGPKKVFGGSVHEDYQTDFLFLYLFIFITATCHLESSLSISILFSSSLEALCQKEAWQTKIYGASTKCRNLKNNMKEIAKKTKCVKFGGPRPMAPMVPIDEKALHMVFSVIYRSPVQFKFLLVWFYSDFHVSANF